ncbi:MAG: hypothetical protein HY913_03690 [Desulfomonile tiedjei]|nr:hypothetical protein [Desulfomonile tiedjei]
MVEAKGSYAGISLLWEDYKLNSDMYREASRHMGQIFFMGIAGVFAALFLGYLCPDARGPVNSVLPCVIIALYVLMEIQGSELMGRERYLAVLEIRMRSMAGSDLPCWESGFRPIIYHTRQHKWLQRVLAAPAAAFYVVCVWKAVPYLRIWHYGVWIPALIGYILLPVLAFYLVLGLRREITGGLAEFEKQVNSRHPQSLGE